LDVIGLPPDGVRVVDEKTRWRGNAGRLFAASDGYWPKSGRNVYSAANLNLCSEVRAGDEATADVEVRSQSLQSSPPLRFVAACQIAGNQCQGLARNNLGESIGPTRALADGRIYVRTLAVFTRLAKRGEGRPDLSPITTEIVQTRGVRQFCLLFPRACKLGLDRNSESWTMELGARREWGVK
jgi:hypothetical protein